MTWQFTKPSSPGWPSASAEVRYPRSADHVSLRATAWDDAGNRVEQEVIRAYGVS